MSRDICMLACLCVFSCQLQLSMVSVLPGAGSTARWGMQITWFLMFLHLRQSSGQRHYVSRVFVRPKQTLLHDMFGVCWRNLTKLAPLMDFGARIKASNFWVKRSMVKVTLGSNMPQNALFGLVVVTCLWRNNSPWSRNYHLVIWQFVELSSYFFLDVVLDLLSCFVQPELFSCSSKIHTFRLSDGRMLGVIM